AESHKLGPVLFQPLLLQPIGIFRWTVRPQAAAAHLVAFHRRAVLPRVARDIPRPDAIARSGSAFGVARSSDLAHGLVAPDRLGPGSRLLPRSVPRLGASARSRARAPSQTTADVANAGRARWRHRPSDDRYIGLAPRRGQALSRPAGGATVPRRGFARLCRDPRQTARHSA